MLTYDEYLNESNSGNLPAFHEAQINSTELGAAVKERFNVMRQHRDTSGVTERCMYCLRANAGEYSANQLSEINKFGGTDAYARVTAVKCRTLTALLEEIYLGPDRPWRIEATPEPTLPQNIEEAIKSLVMSEIQNVSPDQQPDAVQVMERMSQLHDAALDAARRKAALRAESSTKRLDDRLVEGRFYAALKEFIFYFSRMPYAILKGPFFQVRRRVAYIDGLPTVIEEPIQTYASPHPMDVWFSPGVSRPDEGDIIERIRMSRMDLEALRGAPSYDSDAIDGVLAGLPGGHTETFGGHEQERADMEEKESPLLNQDGLYDVLEFHGWIDGPTAANEPLLEEYELDDERSHHITVRTIDGVVISAVPNPDPLERPIYFSASFEPIPGSVAGRGLPEVMVDAQALANAAFRATINNMGLSSGPQVGINSSSMSETQDHDMYPWKRWIFTADPAAPSSPPMMFFQPSDNSNNLMTVYERAMQYADEVTAIPRYAAGGEKVGGAGRTASGLAMLQGNVSKIIKQVAGTIDDNVMAPVLTYQYDITLLTDETGLFRGDETIRALGVAHASKQEAEKMRALEFLQITANPIDMQIIGPDGRAMVLAELADQLGFDHGALKDKLEQRLAAMAQAGQDPTQGEGQPAPGAGPGGQPNAGGPSSAPPGRPSEGLDGAMTARPAAQLQRS